MVVDKVDQAQRCIDHLRSQNVGRATFMVLEKLRDDGMVKGATPENIPRLFDLVTPKEPRFAKAFYKALGNTLVADNLDQANRVAFGQAKRWRVVTLAGQLIETSGAMSGGGTQPFRGAMSSKFAGEAVRPDVLKAYEKDSDDAARKLDEASLALKAAEDELEALVKKAPEIDMSLHKLGLDIDNGTKRIAEAEKRVRDLKSVILLPISSSFLTRGSFPQIAKQAKYRRYCTYICFGRSNCSLRVRVRRSTGEVE